MLKRSRDRRDLGSVYFICLLWAMSLSSCHDPTGEVAKLGEARPQAIAYLDEQTLVVSDVAYRNGRWGEGRVLFIDRPTKKLRAAWYTPAPNPQAIALAEDHLSVLSSGGLSLSGEPRGAISALTLMPKSHLFYGQQHALWHASPIGSYAISAQELSMNEDPFYWISSGLDGVVWGIEFTHFNSHPTSTTHIQSMLGARYASAETLSLGSIVYWNDVAILVDFNTDRIFFFDQSGEMLPCHPELGRYSGVMEGAQTPVVDGDQLWVSFGLSGRLEHIDLLDLDLNDANCIPFETLYEPPLGQVPNDLHVKQGRVFALMSAESAIWVYEAQTAQRIAVWPLPPNVNPWHMAFNTTGDEIAVTEWTRGGVTLINALDGSLIPPIIPVELNPPTGGLCAQADQLKAGQEPRPINEELILNFSADEIAPGVPPEHLYSAPQLLLAFDPPFPSIRIEVQLEEGGDWLELPYNPPLFVTSPDRSSLTPLRGLSSRLIEQSELLVSEKSSCELFDHQHSVITLSLTSVVETSEEQRGWGGGHLLSGHVPLKRVRIKPLEERTESLKLIHAAYRWWGKPTLSLQE